MRFAFFFGLKTLWGRKAIAHLLGAVVGIGLSLVPLIVVLEVADGMIEGITRRYLEVGTYHLQATLEGDSPIERYEQTADRLSRSTYVQHALIERQGIGLAYAEGKRSGVTIRSVPPSLYDDDAGFQRYFKMERGAFDLSSRRSVLLGREVAVKLGVDVGDKIKLLTTLQSQGALKRSLPKITILEVTGIFSTGYQELDKLWIYIPLSTGLSILAEQSTKQFIGIKVNDPFGDLHGDDLYALLPTDARLYTWFQLERSNYKSFQTTKALLVFIMALIVMVAAVNISSALIMIVLEKTQEIGILKSMGAHPRQISMAFVITGFLTGLAGTVFGLVFGLAAAVNINGIINGLDALINGAYRGLTALLGTLWELEMPASITVFDRAYYLEEIPIRLELQELLLVAVLSLGLSTLAAYFPARGAGKIMPLEVLRKH